MWAGFPTPRAHLNCSRCSWVDRRETQLRVWLALSDDVLGGKRAGFPVGQPSLLPHLIQKRGSCVTRSGPSQSLRPGHPTQPFGRGEALRDLQQWVFEFSGEPTGMWSVVQKVPNWVTC